MERVRLHLFFFFFEVDKKEKHFVKNLIRIVFGYTLYSNVTEFQLPPYRKEDSSKHARKFINPLKKYRNKNPKRSPVVVDASL